jgi:ATPase subunit of ABC transporter with duplicated ATPase domains
MGLHFQIKDISLSLPHKLCFEPFSADIYSGARIALIGNNGAGKSLLLQALAGSEHTLCEGQVLLAKSASICYVPQIIAEYSELSGGERFNRAFGKVLAQSPDILLLDEPTNHLDSANRKSLMRFLRSFRGAIIAATHDTALIEACFDTIWHIDHGKIRVFKGSYKDYRAMTMGELDAAKQELSKLKQEQKDAHESLMREQTRAKNARLSGEKKRANKTVLPAKFDQMKSDGKNTTGKKRAAIRDNKEELSARLSELQPHELTPRFHLPHKWHSRETILHIVDGAVGYGNSIIQADITLSLGATERMALVGANGSGKTTIIRAILNDKLVSKTGDWYTLPLAAIGYLDQHYDNLDKSLTVYEAAQAASPDMSNAELRAHLNDFLFRKNEEINTTVQKLSGGERARLSLAIIALQTPALLILDEVTNNIDLSSKEHIMQILRQYPAALLVISHDSDFLREIGVDREYSIS